MKKFGLLTFICEAGSNAHKKRLWQLMCECGKTTVAVASQVRSGKTKSCGHLKSAGNRKTHGAGKTRLYSVWCNMKARCNNPQNAAYKNYGGRGIRIAPEWEDFSAFAAAVGEPPKPSDTLDRIDNSLGYAPGNVRWADRATQARNTRQNVDIEIDGETRCLYDWCRYYEISAGAVYRRVGRGENMISAITRPKARRFLGSR